MKLMAALFEDSHLVGIRWCIRMKATPTNQRRWLWGSATALLTMTLVVAGAMPRAKGDAAAAPTPVDPAASEFFETKVRPVLANNCYSCHSVSAQMGGLRLDTKATVLKGGNSGAVVIPGDAAKSRLVAAVGYRDKVKMPPSGKLKPDEIAALAAWVRMGAPWPEHKSTATAFSANGEYVLTPAQRGFWSFQPVRRPALPAVKNAAWMVSPIDRFVLAKLEAHRLKPSPPADRRTLIRRVTFDLIGLPPTPEEADAFLRDRSPVAYAKVVDRLLASPHYGERWGRHWLDVARYADTKGYVFVEDRNYPNAYTYRDWVIGAFNSDLPYNQFILQQLAADRLPTGDDKRPLSAMGFLTVA